MTVAADPSAPSAADVRAYLDAVRRTPQGLTATALPRDYATGVRWEAFTAGLIRFVGGRVYLTAAGLDRLRGAGS